MKAEGFGFLCFLIAVVGFGIIEISKDYSRDSMIRIEQGQKEAEQIARNQRRIQQIEVVEEMDRLGCVTLDCAIEKSMKK